MNCALVHLGYGHALQSKVTFTWEATSSMTDRRLSLQHQHLHGEQLSLTAPAYNPCVIGFSDWCSFKETAVKYIQNDFVMRSGLTAVACAANQLLQTHAIPCKSSSVSVVS